MEEGARPQKNQPHADSAGGTDVNHPGCPTQRQGGWAVLPLHPSVTGYWPPWMRRVKGVVLPLRNLPTIVCRRGQGKLLATQPAAAGLGKAPGPGLSASSRMHFPVCLLLESLLTFLKTIKRLGIKILISLTFMSSKASDDGLSISMKSRRWMDQLC